MQRLLGAPKPYVKPISIPPSPPIPIVTPLLSQSPAHTWFGTRTDTTHTLQPDWGSNRATWLGRTGARTCGL